MTFKRFCDLAVSFFFTKRCRFCGRVIDIRKNICDDCSSDLGRIEGKICKNCGCRKEDCTCKNHKNYYTAVCAPYYYDAAAGNAIRRLKFRGRTELAPMLAADMAEAFKTYFSDYSFDVITFVPAADADERKRGFNQAELLAAETSKLLGLPCEGTLIKTQQTASQHSLPQNERSGNLLGIFEVRDSFSAENKRILLIDDIKTTGATLNECSKTLLIAGAAEVFCLTAAVTRRAGHTDGDF